MEGRLLIVILVSLSSWLSAGLTHVQPDFNDVTRNLERHHRIKDVQCPDPQDILPCVCIYEDVSDGLVLDCSQVQDEEQLAEIFLADFPSKTFQVLNIINNTGLRLLEDGVFQDISFSEIYIQNSALEEVRDDALSSSFSTVNVLNFQDSQVFSFPFHRLQEFTILHSLYFERNTLHYLSILVSSSLKRLYLSENPLGTATGDTFKNLTVIAVINLDSTLITELIPGVFDELEMLQELSLVMNHISLVPTGAFNLTFSTAPSVRIDLASNNIDKVEEGAFSGLVPGSTISLTDNALTDIKEEVWRPLLESGIIIWLGGNAISCGCGIAWLVTSPALLANTREARCADGVLLVDLNPFIYETICP